MPRPVDANALLDRMARTPDALEALLGALPDADWRWKPTPADWSILEAVVHLLDEETLDFGARLEATLADPARPWPPYDPPARVVEARFNERDPLETLRDFREERGRTLVWLRGLPSPRWDAAHVAPSGKSLRAGDLLAAWAAHDARHLQQVAKRLHGLAARDGAPYSVGYAG
jgi:hypothetical protein